MNVPDQLAKLKALRQLASSLSESAVLAHRAERLDIERSIDRLSKQVTAAIGRKNRLAMLEKERNA